MTITNSAQLASIGFDEQQYQLWYELLERRSGVQMAKLPAELFSSRIIEQAAAQGIANTLHYYQQLMALPDDHPEWNQLLDRLLVRDTRFFRHRESIRNVGELWQQYQQSSQSSNFTAWSVGCSSGEEVYSLALTLEQNRLDNRINFGVIGMDISAQAIAAARAGTYSAQQLTELNDQQRDGYFDPLVNSRYRVGSELKRRTCFIRGNVLDVAGSPQLQSADLIFCQNLLPYFRRWQRQQLINKLAESLNPGGHLIVGPGELASWQPPMLRRIDSKGVQIYRRDSSSK